MKYAFALFTVLPIGFFGSTHVLAQDLQMMLECRSKAALTTGVETLMHQNRVDGYDCRTYEWRRQVSLYCTGSGHTTAFGHRVREFHLVREPNGATVLAVAFLVGPSHVEPALKKAQSRTSDQEPLATATVYTREDGVAELKCTVPGHLGHRGAIAGDLNFRGMQPIPAMRVCAASVGETHQTFCVETADGQNNYQIENLPTGDYYVTAFPLQNNPHQLMGVYSHPMKPCPDADAATGCGPQHLQQVTVFPGDTRQGINPTTWLADVPVSLQGYALKSGSR